MSTLRSKKWKKFFREELTRYTSSRIESEEHIQAHNEDIETIKPQIPSTTIPDRPIPSTPIPSTTGSRTPLRFPHPPAGLPPPSVAQSQQQREQLAEIIRMRTLERYGCQRMHMLD